MLHWPLNAPQPHRPNNDCLNISFTTEHYTRDIRRSFIVHCANGVLRQQLGLTRRRGRQIEGPAYWSKVAVAAAWKLSGMQKKRRQTFKVDFVVDPSAPDSVVRFRPTSSASSTMIDPLTARRSISSLSRRLAGCRAGAGLAPARAAVGSSRPIFFLSFGWNLFVAAMREEHDRGDSRRHWWWCGRAMVCRSRSSRSPSSRRALPCRHHAR
ncbi:MAG: hypothetical protein WDN31_19000 [Hyphomicrobium sp.]